MSSAVSHIVLNQTTVKVTFPIILFSKYFIILLNTNEIMKFLINYKNNVTLKIANVKAMYRILKNKIFNSKILN